MPWSHECPPTRTSPVVSLDDSYDSRDAAMVFECMSVTFREEALERVPSLTSSLVVSSW